MTTPDAKDVLVQWEGTVRCAPVRGAPLFTLSGTSRQGAPVTVTFRGSMPPGLPTALESACVERNADYWLIRAGRRAWPLAPGPVHVHRGLPGFYQAIPPREPPWHRRLLWTALLALAARPLGVALLRRLRGQG